MKDLNYYINLKYPYHIDTINENEGGGFIITYPDLPGCMSDSETLNEVVQMGEDAKKAWIETALENGMEIPEPYSTENMYSGRITLRAPKSMHKMLVEQAESEGVSLNQYMIYLLSSSARSKNKERIEN
ncbi:MAG: type II toxin-antitoxin system HicB family antitoxin [Sedimentibacter sp.]